MDNSYIIDELKRRYYHIFTTIHGKMDRSVQRMMDAEAFWRRSDEEIQGYKDTVNSMVNPEKATADEIRKVAIMVKSGILEFNYADKNTEGIPLGEIAAGIIALHDELLKETKEETPPNFEELDPDHPDIIYQREAADAYGEIMHDNNRHLGGRVAVIDSNREKGKFELEVNSWRFRNLEAIHFAIIEEAEDNLFTLVDEGKLSITGINVI